MIPMFRWTMLLHLQGNHIALKKEATCSSEALVPYHIAKRSQNPEDHDLNLQVPQSYIKCIYDVLPTFHY